MIIGIGTDIIAVERVGKSWERHGERFAERILAPEEMVEFSECKQSVSFLAKRFAVKEATSKALGTGVAKGISWHDITVGHDELGKPLLLLKGAAQARAAALGANHLHVSISDEREHVVAFVILES